MSLYPRLLCPSCCLPISESVLIEQNIVSIPVDANLIALQAILPPEELEDDEAGARAGYLSDRVPPESSV